MQWSPRSGRAWTSSPARLLARRCSESNGKWTNAPGSVLLKAKATGLPKDSVANVALIVALDKEQLTECTGKLPPRQLDAVHAGIDVVLGR